MKKTFLLFVLLVCLNTKAQQKNIEIINTQINSSYAELGVSFLNNNLLLFASSKKDPSEKNFSKSRRRNNKHLFLDLYVGAILENGDINQIQKFSNEENNKIFESDLSLTPDGKTIYFTWNNYYKTQKRKDSAKWKTLHIMRGKINANYEISEIEAIPVNNEDYSVRSPELTKDGKKLFFISDMPGGFGGFDVYYIELLSNNQFGKPVNLGENVNTDKHELYPFVDDANNLYFSTYGRDGLGSLDIFKSAYENENYIEAINLKAPINSKYDDFAYVINGTTNKGYFTSNRKGGIGDVDIYAFLPKEKPCYQSILVSVYNNKTKEIANNTVLSLYENNVLKTVQNTYNKKELLFTIKCNSSYKIVAEHNDYSSNEIEFETTSEGDVSINKELFLEPLICEQVVAGFVKQQNSNSILNNTTVHLYKNDSLVNSQFIAQENNGFRFSLECNTSYKLVAEKENFEGNEIQFKTENKRTVSLKKDIVLTPLECHQIVEITVLNKENEAIINNVISSINEGVNRIKSTFSDATGKLQFELNCNKEYSVFIKKQGFIDNEISFKSGAIRNEIIQKTIHLIPVKCEPLISGIILNEETNAPLQNASVAIFTNDDLITSVNSNHLGEFSFKGACNSEYKLISSLKDYSNKTSYVVTNSNADNTYLKEIKLKSNIEFVIAQQEKMIKTNPIYFDLDSDNLRPTAKIELNKVVGVLKKYPTMKIDVRSHTDSRAPDAYNMVLSGKRARSTMRYIISQGINSDRVSGEGFGETNLVNKCSNGVKCTKEEHELNRRTEFVIVSN